MFTKIIFASIQEVQNFKIIGFLILVFFYNLENVRILKGLSSAIKIAKIMNFLSSFFPEVNFKGLHLYDIAILYYLWQWYPASAMETTRAHNVHRVLPKYQTYKHF